MGVSSSRAARSAGDPKNAPTFCSGSTATLPWRCSRPYHQSRRQLRYYQEIVVNPHKKAKVDTRTPDQLMDIIEAKGREVAEALAILRDTR